MTKIRYWRVRKVAVPPYRYKRYQTQYSTDHVTWESSHSYRTLKDAALMVSSRVDNPLRGGSDEWEPGESWALLSDAERDHLTVMKQIRGWTRWNDQTPTYRMQFRTEDWAFVGWDFVTRYGEEENPFTGF